MHKLFFILLSFLSLLGCVSGGNSTYADGGDGKFSIPINVNKVDYGQVCYSQAGACPMYQPLVVGALCYCPTPYGNAPGKVVQ